MRPRINKCHGPIFFVFLFVQSYNLHSLNPINGNDKKKFPYCSKIVQRKSNRGWNTILLLSAALKRFRKLIHNKKCSRHWSHSKNLKYIIMICRPLRFDLFNRLNVHRIDWTSRSQNNVRNIFFITLYRCK